MRDGRRKPLRSAAGCLPDGNVRHYRAVAFFCSFGPTEPLSYSQ